MNHCIDCRHKEPFPSYIKKPGWYICGRIPHADDREADDIAYAQDGEDYYASLRVMDSFGCVLWKAKA